MNFLTLPDHAKQLGEYAANPQQRIRTGFESIDLLIEGPAAGEVCTIIGRSYSGKSLLATAIMVNNKRLGSIFFSLEMPARQAMIRMYAQWADYPAPLVRKMVAENNIADRFETMAYDMEKHIIVDTPRLGPREMGAYIEEYEAYHGQRPDFVIVDYLELVGGNKQSEGGWQSTEATAAAIKDMAKAHDMPVFLLHQTNRTEDDWKPPTLRSARGGGDVEADFVVGLWQPARDPELMPWDRKALWDIVRMNVLKNRHSGEMNLPWEPLEFRREDSLRFTDLRAANGADPNDPFRDLKEKYE